MIANYHTHTARCGHAVGADEEYAFQAAASGLKTLGFSDHTPYPFEGGLFTRSRMTPAELPAYVRSVMDLRRQYQGRLEIRLGVEAEYFPGFWKEQVTMLRDQGVEYILLGQHWAAYREDVFYCGSGTEDESLLAEHCGTVREGMQTGLITYLAHPDMFLFTGGDKVYEKHIRPLCRQARDSGIPLELNLLGIRSGRHYPAERFWRIAAEENCPVVLGCDAHNPQWLSDPGPEKSAREMAARFGLQILETVDLRPLG